MMIALTSLISIAMLFVLVFLLYDRYRIDRVRQELFLIRDRLFDEAARGAIDFDSASYVFTRTVINGMIRFAHRLSLSRFVSAIALYKPQDRERAKTRIQHVFSASSAADRQLCERYLNETNKAIFMHLSSSPWVLIVLVPVVASMVALLTGYSIASEVVSHCRNWFVRLDMIAYEEGLLPATSSNGMTFTHTAF